MYEKRQKKWDKHIDFILLDKLSITIALFLGYVVRHGLDLTRKNIFPTIYIRLWIILLIFDMCVGFLFESYTGILRRGYLDELKKAVKHGCITDMFVMVTLFISKELSLYSRKTMSVYFIVHILLMYTLRCLRKHSLRKKMINNPYVEHMLILTDKKHKDTCVNKLSEDKYRNYKIVGVVIAEQEDIVKKYKVQYEKLSKKEESVKKDDFLEAMEEVAATFDGITADTSDIMEVCKFDELEDYLLNNVIDSIFVDMEMTEYAKSLLINYLMSSGVTVHMNLINLPHELLDKSVEQIGEFTVLTAGMRVATKRQLIEKRLMDIAGGLTGLIITAIAFVIFAPIIYIQSPGPVFFKQDRVGKNGRIFKLYKFRSMYMDAEERKKEFACPYLNNAVLEELGYIYNENEPVNLGRTLVLPPKYLDPIAPGEGMKLLRCEDTISIHHYSASWMGNKTRLKRRIIRIIGQENVSKIKQFCQRLKMG